MTDRPFGADTLIIPFTWHGAAPTRPRVARMSRMRPAGELFRYGVVKTADAQQATAPANASPAFNQAGDGFGGELFAQAAPAMSPSIAPAAPPPGGLNADMSMSQAGIDALERREGQVRDGAYYNDSAITARSATGSWYTSAPARPRSSSARSTSSAIVTSSRTGCSRPNRRFATEFRIVG